MFFWRQGQYYMIRLSVGRLFATFFLLLSLHPIAVAMSDENGQEVSFPGGDLVLGGVLYKPEGSGPFPAVLYNHGSAPGMLNKQASDVLGPLFVKHGWVFFMPYRRGQGLSSSAGPYIGDEIRRAEKSGGKKAAVATMVRLLRTDHLNDQLAALSWLRRSEFVRSDRIAVAGNSFGGIESVLGVAAEKYCAAIDASGGAESWAEAPELQQLMAQSVLQAKAPVLFFQAENDFDLSPSKTLSKLMLESGHKAELKIYPRFGSSAKEGHSFAYRGGAIWEADVFRFLDKNCGG